MPSVLVAGLCVVDLVHRVTRVPGPDEKVTALSRELTAGGPATNAAVTVALLEGTAALLAPLGSSALAAVARADLDRPGLTVYDLAADDPAFEPNVSSVVVVEATGERSVVSRDAAEIDEAVALAAARRALAAAEADIVLLDGHYPAVATAVATWARTRRIPVVLDAGRWKPHFADLLPLVDEIIASAAFTVPSGSIVSYAHARAVRVVAQTHGAAPIDLSVAMRTSRVDVPPVDAVDTLGAGDVLHGGYAYYRAAGDDPEESLRRAAEVASFRCRFPGSRTWTRFWPET
jgi:sugar/nucleoside kinase (ribokinase family)